MGMADIQTLFSCMTNRWSPVIGDPSLMGWVIVAVYAVTGISCMAAARMRRRDRRFWVMLSIVLLFLAVNKQLDLQSAVTAAGRCLSQMQGWYDARRSVQVVVILGLLVTSCLILLVSVIRLRHSLNRIGLALVGFGLLLTFVAVRAVGFHHFDAFIGITIGQTRMNWVLELTGPAMIFVNAVLARRIRPDKPSLHGGSRV